MLLQQFWTPLSLLSGLVFFMGQQKTRPGGCEETRCSNPAISVTEVGHM